MMTILLVDDERIEREGLRFLLEKHYQGMTIEEAANGAEALKWLEQHRADIMITDIRMPFMDGLALTERARSIAPEMKILLYTAYGEFEYARQAIKFGVSTYLLKPIKEQLFYEEMDAILHECASSENYRRIDRLERERVWYDLLHGRLRDKEMDERLQLMGVDAENAALGLVLAVFSWEYLPTGIQAFERKFALKVEGDWILDPYRILLLLNDANFADMHAFKEYGKVLQREMMMDLNVCPTLVLAQVRGVMALNSAYRFLDEQCERRLFAPRSLITLTNQRKLHSSDVKAQMDYIKTELLEKAQDKDAACVELEALAQLVQLLDGTIDSYMLQCIKDITSFVCTTFMVYSGNKWEKIIADYDDLRTITKALHGLAVELADIDDEKFKNDLMIDETTNRIICWIHESYADAITLDDAAKLVYMSPQYVSYLFKRQVGKTFIKYLTDYRLEQAARLLSNSNKRITDIMISTGYNNSSYFSSVFRAKYGVTPSQYRKHKRGS